MLLALVSRNELADVEALFATRTDFPLRLAHFSAIEVSWGDKASALERIAHRLRIGPDAIVIVDDNPGELATVAAPTRSVTVHAGRTRVRPRLRSRTSPACSDGARPKRIAPGRRPACVRGTRQPARRERLAGRLSAQPRSAAALFVGAGEHLARVCDLVGKTNQFNLSLRRLNEAEIAQRLEEHTGNVIAIALSDRLSDSGVIAAVVGRCRDGVLQVEELSVSCRALGRRLEDGMLTRALRLMAEGRAPSRAFRSR